MNWLWNAIGSGAQFIVVAVFQVLGVATNSILSFLVKEIAIPLLNATVFAPFTLTGSGCANGGTTCEGHIVSAAFQTGWHVMAAASGGVALIMVLWSALRVHLGATSGSGSDKSGIVDGLVTWAAVLIGGQWFFETMLAVANGITVSLVTYGDKLANMVAGTPEASVTTVALLWVMAEFFGGVLLLVMVGIFMWLVITWLWRQVELVFFTSLLPILAALSIGGNKQAFEWGWNEAVGALFAQLAMAVAFYFAFLLMRSYPLPTGSWSGTAFGLAFVHLLLGATTLYLVGKAPGMLASLTGHRHAGFGSVAAGVAAGSLMGRGMSTALRMSKGGAALHAIAKSKERSAEASAGAGGDRMTVGEMVMGTSNNRTAIGKRVDTALDRVKAGGGRAYSDAKEAFKGTSVGMGLSLAAESTAGKMALFPARVVAGAAGSVAKAAVMKARSAASYAVQPRTTLGRDLSRSYGNAGLAEAQIGYEGSRRLGAEVEAFNKDRDTMRNPPPDMPESPEYGKRESAMLHHSLSRGMDKGTGEMRDQYSYVFEQRLSQFKGQPAARTGRTREEPSKS